MEVARGTAEETAATAETSTTHTMSKTNKTNKTSKTSTAITTTEPSKTSTTIKTSTAKTSKTTNRWLPTAAVTTAAVLACAGAAWGNHLARTGSVGVAVPKTSDPAASADCAKLIAALPATLEGADRRGVVGTAPDVKRRAAAWGSPTTILRCGVAEPPAITVGGPDYTPLSNRYANMGDKAFVNWLIDEHQHSVTYTTTDRAVYVEITVPFGDQTQKQAASNALVDLAPLIVTSIPNKDGKFVDDQAE